MNPKASGTRQNIYHNETSKVKRKISPAEGLATDEFLPGLRAYLSIQASIT
jgi:hypothetical protein